MSSTVPTGTSTLLKRLGRDFLMPHKARLSVAILCMLVVSATTGMFAYMIKPLIDEVFVAKSVDMLYTIALIILVLNSAKAVAAYVQNFFMEVIGQKMVADLQKKLYSHVIHQDLTFFQAFTTAGLTSRFLFDMTRLRQAVSQVISGGIRDTTMVIGLTANLFVQDWQLAAFSLIIFPLAIVPIRRLGRMMRKYSTGSQERSETLGAILHESFTHNRQVKIYTMERYEKTRAFDAISDVLTMLIKAARVRSMSGPIMEFVGTIATVAVFIFGGFRAFEGDLSAGGFLSFLTSLLMLYRPVKGLANINNTLQDGLAAAERTFAVIDTTSKVKDHAPETTLPIKRGDILFSRVTFSYPDGTSAIKNLNLKIPAGKTVALVGASGAGKSTILNLIPRFFDPSTGKIEIDGTDISHVSLKSLRESIGLVTQDVAIFDDTIFNNIAYGHPGGIEGAKKNAVIDAAKAADAHDFIMALDDGYNTRVGEAGFKLSGGQKQRLAIARAMLKNAPILLLDEATSNLDTESEKNVQNALNKLMKGRTALIVAHRLSTIVGADMIHVLDGGKIVESGTHSELMLANGLYTKLHKLQATS